MGYHLIRMTEKLFHISEEPDISTFAPRPSPSRYDSIKGDVVFAITEKLLHNYLLPRDCPRVTYYANQLTLAADKENFLKKPYEFVISVEEMWKPIIRQTTLYCYEFDATGFSLLDECAGYYISYHAQKPVSVTCIQNPLEALSSRHNIEIRFLQNLWNLAEAVVQSTLSFSLIRMRNAAPRK